MKTTWNLNEAVELCQKIERVVTSFGAHVALAGGVLTRGGDRKDMDIILYPHQTTAGMQLGALRTALGILGIKPHPKLTEDDLKNLRKYGSDRKYMGPYFSREGKNIDVFVVTGYSDPT